MLEGDEDEVRDVPPPLPAARAGDVTRRASSRSCSSRLAVLAACGKDDDGSSAPATTSTTASPSTSTTSDASAAGTAADVYADDASWLCRPEADDACEDDVDATVVARRRHRRRPTPSVRTPTPPIDCFYVYPTVSLDPGANSDMEAGAEEKNVVAPAGGALRVGVQDVRTALPAGDAHLAAQLARRHGRWLLRGVLAGVRRRAGARGATTSPRTTRAAASSSSGTRRDRRILQQLLEQEIDPDPAQRKLLVSAMLMGTSVHESDLPHIPPCRSNTQTGCIITYSTFRDTAPPPPDSYFARPKG